MPETAFLKRSYEESQRSTFTNIYIYDYVQSIYIYIYDSTEH